MLPRPAAQAHSLRESHSRRHSNASSEKPIMSRRQGTKHIPDATGASVIVTSALASSDSAAGSATGSAARSPADSGFGAGSEATSSSILCETRKNKTHTEEQYERRR